MTTAYDRVETVDEAIDNAIAGMNHVAAELGTLYQGWVTMGVDSRATDWLLRQIMELGWHAGRLSG